jgi:hypothetical protein
MLSKLKCQLKYWLVIEMFHRPHLLTPDKLELHLNTFYGEQESEQRVVLLHDIST